jgi:hypothetical protein
MGKFDQYAEAERIAQRVAEEGLPEWRDHIIGAMRAGATGGEVVGLLGEALRELLEARVELSPETRSRCRALLSRLREAWGPGAAF